ncbi:tripartite tricarboxylate transporter substrate binding protein, partial [Rhizobium ruizarguesonis]
MALSDITRRTGFALGFGVLAFAVGASAAAADFPDRAITMVVPFAAGGSLSASSAEVASSSSS